MKRLNVAVVGATGLVGKEVLNILEERDFPLGKLSPLATEESAGMIVEFKGEPYVVGSLEKEAFDSVDFAIFTASCEASEEFAPSAAKAGAVVIDNSARFRMDPDVPLVVPEINGHAAKGHKGIIANPNCSTIQLLMVLHPLNLRFGVKRAVVSTYQSVSGSGRKALDELADQSLAVLSLREPTIEAYPHRIAFNLLPHVGDFDDSGYTGEEIKLKRESAKILAREDILISPTCVRAPVFSCHSQSVNIALRSPACCEEIRSVLADFPGVIVIDGALEARLGIKGDEDDSDDYPLPSSCGDRDEVFVGRIRLDDTVEHGVNLWSVMDNLRKGAALNAIQIMELLAK